MVGATTAMFYIYAILQLRRFKASPKDTWGGFWSAVVQKGLLHLHKRVSDSKNWRPNAIVFAGDPSERQHLVHFARWLVQGRGLATYFYLLRGDILIESRRAAHLEPAVRETVGRIYPEMLSQVAVTRDIYEGIINASQSYGLSGMKPNTVVMGWGEESTHPAEFTLLVRSLLALDHNLLFIEQDENRSFGAHETIDIWWRGLDRNGELMLLIAYLLKSSATWSRAKVRINVLVDDVGTQQTAESSLRRVIDDARVRAEPNVMSKTERDKSIAAYRNAAETVPPSVKANMALRASEAIDRLEAEWSAPPADSGGATAAAGNE